MKSPLIYTFFAAVFTIVVIMNCKDTKPTTSSNAVLLNAKLPQYSLPQDVLDSCNIDDASFASWFAGVKVTENGFVNSANNVTFDPENNCSFYRWSEQMFLLLTSSGAKYNGSTTVFESPVLYVVSPERADNTRILIPYQKGDPLDLLQIAAQNGSKVTQFPTTQSELELRFWHTMVQQEMVW